MKRKKWMLLLLAAVLGALLWAAVGMNAEETETVENAGQAVSAPKKTVSLAYQGQEYPLKEHLQTVLLIGTDSVEAYEAKESLQDRYNDHQADFLILLVQDTEAGTTEVIQLNRDTMTDVPWLDVTGNYGGTEFKQIGLSFHSGDGGRSSCLNTVDAVSSLVFDAPVQHYIQIPMSGIPVLNDLVGGVPVTIPEDLTQVDPAFTMGATVHLNGDQAEKFVRAGGSWADDTNPARMYRQQIYLDSFLKQAQKGFGSDPQSLLQLMNNNGEFLKTDLTARQLYDLLQNLDQSVISPIRTAEGELTEGAEHYEFYVDEASLWEIVKKAYCK